MFSLSGIDLFQFIVTTAIFFCGCVLSSSLIWVMWKDRKARYARKTDWGSTIITMSCLVWSYLFSAFSIYILIKDTNVMKDHALCQFMGFAINVLAGNSIAGNFSLALDRFFVIIKERECPKWLFLASLGFLEFYIVAVSIYMLAGTDPAVRFAPLELETYCFFNLLLPSNERNYLAIWPTFAAVIYMFLVCNMIVTTYMMIYQKTRKIKKSVALELAKTRHVNSKSSSSMVRNSTNQSISPIDNNSDSLGTIPPTTPVATSVVSNRIDAERRVFYRCLALTGTFLACYGFTFLLCLYRLFWQQPVSKWLEALSSITASCDVIISPILIFRFSSRLQGLFYDTFWPSSWDRKHVSWLIGSGAEQ